MFYLYIECTLSMKNDITHKNKVACQLANHTISILPEGYALKKLTAL